MELFQLNVHLVAHPVGQAKERSVGGEWPWQIKGVVRNVSEGVNERRNPGAAEENSAFAPGTDETRARTPQCTTSHSTVVIKGGEGASVDVAPITSRFQLVIFARLISPTIVSIDESVLLSFSPGVAA